MDKLAELILGKYVNLAEEFLTARFNSYTPEDLEKVAGYLIETDRKSSEVFEKQGIFSQAWKAKSAVRSAQKAHDIAKSNQKAQKILANTKKLEQQTPGSINSLVAGALAASTVGALGGGLLTHQYDIRTENDRQRATAARFYWEGLNRGRSPKLA